MKLFHSSYNLYNIQKGAHRYIAVHLYVYVYIVYDKSKTLFCLRMTKKKNYGMMDAFKTLGFKRLQLMMNLMINDWESK